MWRTAIKGVFAHKVRLALTALAIVSGVAFVAGTYVLSDTMTAAFDDLFTELTADIDVTVRTETEFTLVGGPEGTAARDRIPEELLDVVQGVPGVGVAQGSVGGFAMMVDKQGEAIAPQGPPTLGFNWGGAEELSQVVLRTGRPPQTPTEVAIDAGTAEDHGFAVGDTIEILFVGPPEEFTLVGTFGYGEVDNFLGATVAAFETETAQRVLDAEGEFDQIEVAAAEGVSVTALADNIRAALPQGIEAVTQATIADEQSDAISSGLGFFTTALLVFAGIAVFVGAFIIYNTFSIIVAQRTRELALLRAVGATATQVTVMVVIEAVIVGVIASLVGLGIGVLLAVGLQAGLSGLGIDLPSTGLQFQVRTAVVAIAVGVIVTVASAVLPARKAASVPPVAAMRDAGPIAPRSLRQRLAIGLGVTAVGLVLLLVGLFGDLDAALPLVGVGALIMFLGVGALSPLVAKPISRFLGAPLPRVYGVTGTLAQENAMRRPQRTATTAAALMIGLALVAFALIFGTSLKASAGQVIDDSVAGDFVITGTGFQGFSPDVVERLEAEPEIAVATGVRQGPWRFEGRTKTLYGVDPERIDQVVNITMLEGSLDALADGGMIVHVDEMGTRGWTLGDLVPMEFAKTGLQQVEIVGVYEAEEALVGFFNIGLGTYSDNFVESLDIFALADAEPGVAAADARAAVERIALDFPNVEVRDQIEFKQEQERQVDQLLAVVTALLALALIIALIGITNTLALSIFERTREIGLLRAVGMSRRQIRRMVRWEAVIVAVFGAILGLAVGVFFGWAVVQAAAGLGIKVFAIPAGSLISVLVVAGFAGVAAAIFPARRAAKLNVLDAIQYE